MTSTKELVGEVNSCCHRVAFRYDLHEQVTEAEETMLREEAERRATEMIPQGYHSGELNCLLPDHDTGEDDSDPEFRGWWEIKNN